MIKCNGLIETSIIFTYVQPWSQDDISTLVAQFLQQYSNVNVIEEIQGADRVTIRLLWQKIPLVLHFECYSESIWLEAEHDSDHSQLAVFYANLCQVD